MSFYFVKTFLLSAKRESQEFTTFWLNLNLMEDWKLDWNPRGIVNVQSFWLRQLYLWSFLEIVIIQTNDLTLHFRDIILNQPNQTCVLQEPPKQHENLWMYGHNGFVWEVLWNPLLLKFKLKQQHHEHNCTEMKAECNLHWKAAMTLKHWHHLLWHLRTGGLTSNMNIRLTHPWDLARFCVGPRDPTVTGYCGWHRPPRSRPVAL